MLVDMVSTSSFTLINPRIFISCDKFHNRLVVIALLIIIIYMCCRDVNSFFYFFNIPFEILYIYILIFKYSYILRGELTPRNPSRLRTTIRVASNRARRASLKSGSTPSFKAGHSS